jgi:hypothetical protein
MVKNKHYSTFPSAFGRNILTYTRNVKHSVTNTLESNKLRVERASENKDYFLCHLPPIYSLDSTF